MSDVVIRLVGGLGNQMFQYAAAKAVALRSGAELVLDLSWFSTVSDRQYALGPLSVSAHTLGDMPPKGTPGHLLKETQYRLARYTERYFLRRPVFHEKHFHFDPAMLDVHAPVHLEGYFQSEKYFLEYRDQIASEFKLASPPGHLAQAILEKMATHDAISLHVRRGDYAADATTSAYHGLCSLEYYYRGLGYISEGLSNPHCYVFSDDPEWVRANFSPPLPMTIMDIHGPHEAHEDLRLMTACKHFVVANSSFSWWGAWLSANPEKIVVAPSRWFEGSSSDTKDLIPPGWVKL